MARETHTFAFVEAQLRKATFGVLSTISPGGGSQTTGILYGVSAPGTSLCLYLITEQRYVKVRNISGNPQVSFLVPYPHHWLRVVPASCISFQGTAKILPADHPEGREAFNASRILRMNLKEASSMEGIVFIRVKPKRKIQCYGIGIGLIALARNISEAGYSVEIPSSRRE